MYEARLICSDEGCAQERDAQVRTLDEIDALACECGCTFQVLGWPDWVEDERPVAQVIAFPVRARIPERLAS